MDLSIRHKAFNGKVFKAYDVRGFYPEELDHNTIELIAEAFADYLKEDSPNNTCVIGEDVRWSSPEIAEIIKPALQNRGVNIIDIGLATSPMFVFALNQTRSAGGIMITASHNSIRYNGLKIYKGPESLSEKRGMPELKKIIAEGIKKYKGPIGNIRKENFASQYGEFLLKKVKFSRKMKAVFDAGGGAVGPIFSQMLKNFSNIDFEFILPEADPSLTKRETNPLTHKAQIKTNHAIKKNGADVGFVFDPDGDRAVILDEKGEMVRSDAILWLLSKKMVHLGESVVYDVRCSRALAEDLEKEGIRAHKSRVGHAFIREMMRAEDAVAGGELSGHFYFKDFFFSDSAIFTTLKILEILSQSKLPLSELVKPYFRYFHSGEVNFHVDNREGVISSLETKYSDAERDYLDGATFKYPDWWFNIRFSNTEDVLRLVFETTDHKSFVAKKEELFHFLFSKGARLA